MMTNVIKDLFCEVCSLQFDKKYVYDVHIKLVHEKTLCPQSKIDKTVVEKEKADLGEETSSHRIQNSTAKINISKNVNAIHEEKKPHKCSICDYSFKIKY